MTHFNAAILEAAGRHIGTAEWPGSRHNPVIQGFFAAAGADQNTADEVPWCAAYVGAVLAELGLPNTGRLNARSYLDWGVPVELADAKPGDVVIFSRGDPSGWQGHVAFLVRFDGDKILCRGGNQSNEVNDALYAVSRLLGIRRAVGADLTGRPVLRHGSRGSHVRALQERLIELGYPVGRVDGVFKDRTRAAVQAFQSDSGLSLDGVVGGQTWSALDSAEPRPARDISADDLRESGSRTMAAADQGQALTTVGGGLAAVGVIADRIDEAAQAVEQGAGVLDQVQGLLVTYWPILAVGAAALLLWHFFGQIKAARVEDARTGRNLGR